MLRQTMKPRAKSAMEPAIAPIAMPIFAPTGSLSLSSDAALLVSKAVGWLVPSVVVALDCPFTLFDPVMEAAADRDASPVDIAAVNCNAYVVGSRFAIDVMLNIGPLTADLYASR